MEMLQALRREAKTAFMDGKFTVYLAPALQSSATDGKFTGYWSPLATKSQRAVNSPSFVESELHRNPSIKFQQYKKAAEDPAAF
jgi:hypothetical protein